MRLVGVDGTTATAASRRKTNQATRRKNDGTFAFTYLRLPDRHILRRRRLLSRLAIYPHRRVTTRSRLPRELWVIRVDHCRRE